MKRMESQLIELLNINGVSGKEEEVREYLKPVLSELVDTVTVDAYGNLLGELKCGNGKGSTVLLSAHMDTVKGVMPDKKLVLENGSISADNGALGADDRAGIAIILTVLRNVKNLSFNGTIKISFSREEEIGCVGAGKINPEWYKGTDLAIIVDRRGSRDIVVGCSMAYCTNNVGEFMEDMSELLDMDYQCVEGGVSDAMAFAENGINSINLSAGYYNEHTSKEFVVVSQMFDTAKLVLQAIALINDFSNDFGKLEESNKWVENWYKNDSYGHYYEEEEEDMWAEAYDSHGDVYVYELGKDVIIQQGNQEIRMSVSSMRAILGQLNKK